MFWTWRVDRHPSIPAVKAGAIMTGVDIVPNLLEQANIRAQREGVRVQFDESHVAPLPALMYRVTSSSVSSVITALQYPFSVPETVEFSRRYYDSTQRAFADLPQDK
jgi:hypothetical protein